MKEDITIDKEFAKLLPGLSPEEKLGLETNLITEGCRDPLVVWNTKEGRILVDGHNRYSICYKNRISFEVVEKFFASREEVINWMIDNQLGKRNITAESRQYLIGQKYNLLKTKRGGSRKSKGHSDTLIDTSEKIGDAFSVAGRTVKRAGDFAKAVDVIEEKAGPEAKQKILAGESKINQKDIAALAQKKPEDVKAVFEGEKSVSSVLGKTKPFQGPQPDKQQAVESQPVSFSHRDAKGAIWRLGINMLMALGGMTEKQARIFLGGMYKNAAGREELVSAAIAATASKWPEEPKSYLVGMYNRFRGGNGRADLPLKAQRTHENLKAFRERRTGK